MFWPDHIPGRWLRRRPTCFGVYAMRYGNMAFVNRFDASPVAWTERQLELALLHRGRSVDVEFLYLDGDDLGRPTRADEARVVEIARANGWRAYAETLKRTAIRECGRARKNPAVSRLKQADRGARLVGMSAYTRPPPARRATHEKVDA